MTKRTRLLVASLLPFLPSLSLAGCASDSEDPASPDGMGAAGAAGLADPMGGGTAGVGVNGLGTGTGGSGLVGAGAGLPGTGGYLGTPGGVGNSGGVSGSAGGIAGGSGGVTAGSGGVVAGSGGATAGSGGATAGSGGATAGSGGATAGSGGATAGSGGATAGSGGTTAGSGGTTAGSSGTTGSTDSSCVPGVDTGDPCDPAVDTETCVRSTRDCVCGESGEWTCTPTDGSGGTTGDSGGTTGDSGGTTGDSGGTTGDSGGTTGDSGGTTGDSGGTTGDSGGTTGDSGGGSSGGASESCTLPDLPDDVSSLPRNEKLPDPFTFFNGDKVTTKAQWECRRREIQAMAAKYIYGPYPFEPDETTGTVSGNSISITCKEGSKTETFSASISGSGSVITIDMSSGILPSSRKTLSFGSGFEGKIRNLFGLSEMNTNVATGWMVDRVIEVLEQNPDSGHDPTKMAVSGCSGCGKGAFLVGVFSRIPMTVIVESGGGGAANLRQAEWFRHGDGNSSWQCQDALPQSIDNLEDSGICGPWVTSAASQLRSRPDLVNHLPFDQHLLLATIAPRYLVHFSNNNGVNSWCHLGGTCEALSAWAAAPVWNALGVPENMAFEMYNGGHCSVGDTGIAAAMFRRAFEGDTSGNTGGVTIPDSGVQQPVSEWESMWIDWDMQTVLQ